MKCRRFVCCAIFLFAIAVPAGAAQAPLRQEVLDKYEKVLSLAEDLNLYDPDLSEPLFRIRQAGDALLENDLIQANRILDEVIQELDQLKDQQAYDLRAKQRFDLLETYVELIQKYILLALLAFLFVSVPYFRRLLSREEKALSPKWIFSCVLVFFAVILSYYDWVRYQQSAWSFFDIQIVLLALAAIVNGFWFGMGLGIVLAAFRLILQPEAWVYAVILFVVGAVSGATAHFIKSFNKLTQLSFGLGCLAGAIQGAIIYVPLLPVLSWTYVLLSIFLVALSEGVGLALFFWIVTTVLRRQKQSETEEELLKTQLLFLQAQIRPHFLFNALNTISSICLREKAPTAEKLVVDLADFLRISLRQQEQKITLEEELAYIDSYLEIEKARYQDRLNIKKDIQILDTTWNQKIPILTLQPLVENAVRHGVTKKTEGGTVIFRMREEGESLQIEIVDDGVGMSERQLGELLSRKPAGGAAAGLGIGLRNIQQRLRKFYGSHYQFKVESVPGKGTKVSLTLPLQNKENNR